jgi:hypothetical protein
MSDVLSEEKKQQVIALGKLGWPLRRIEQATGVRRETASAYLKSAGVVVCLPGWGLESSVAVDSMAYAGRYTFSCDKVAHQVEIASLQNWVNTDRVRFVTLQGNRMFLRNTPQSRGGVMVTIESVWERLN